MKLHEINSEVSETSFQLQLAERHLLKLGFNAKLYTTGGELILIKGAGAITAQIYYADGVSKPWKVVWFAHGTSSGMNRNDFAEFSEVIDDIKDLKVAA